MYRRSLITALLLATLVAACPAPLWSADNLELVPPSRARANLWKHWNDFRKAIEAGDMASAKEKLGFALESKWDGGFGDMPEASVALIDYAQEKNAAGERESAEWLLTMAKKFSPDSYRVELSLGRYHLGGGPIAPGAAAGHYINALELLPEDFPELHRSLARAIVFPLAFILVLGAALAAVMVFRYGKLLAHDFGDFFPPEKMNKWITALLCAVILTIPLIAGFSLWWLLAWIFLVLSLYMTRGERVVVYLWLVASISMPWLVSKHSVLSANRADPVLQAAIRSRNGIPEPGDGAILRQAYEKNPDDLLASFSYARTLTRQGMPSMAATVYTKVYSREETARAGYNNVAEVYAWAGQLKNVYKALSAAADKGESVEVTYNIGQYHFEAGDLLKVEDQMKLARELDEEKFERIRERYNHKRINRFIAPIPLPAEIVRDRSWRGSPAASELARGKWAALMGAPSGTAFMASCLGFAAAILLLRAVSRKWKLAERCSSCGNPICPRCHRQPKTPGICLPCYNVFRGEGGVDLQFKVQKRAEVQQYRDVWRRLGALAAVVLPGSGQMALAGGGSGLILVGLAAALIAGVWTRSLVWPPPSVGFTGGTGVFTALFIGLYALLVVVSFFTFRKVSDTWR